ncbi:probable G-protein coupled receptor 139 [Alosa sapidissima]|uniref:probable G-protein coupled receptor 139 n=1 Tax=Alosa sapidissima TaxID=34773 RepID=UPI001C09B1EF|nr:probable G-protein coupled receptor 139 [Alosa sapidissima]
MEHSHIVPPLPSNGSSRGEGRSALHDAQDAHACPLAPLPLVYYSSLLCLGLPANILTVVILSQLVRRRHKSSYNYLLALAVADLLVLLLIVFLDFLLEDFILGRPLPPVVNAALQVLEFWALHASVWTAVPLTADRYIAVCHPLRYHSVSYPARARRVIATVYATCLLTAAPYYWWPELWHGPHQRTEEGVREHVLVWAHCVAVYLLPCSVFLSLNAAIVLKLRRRSCFRLRGYSTGKTTAILLAITSVFAVLWAPRTAIILYHLYAGPAALTSDPARVRTLHLLSDLANMLALLNTAVNFFLYCFISRRFRRMAAGVLRSTCGCRGRRPPPAPVFAAHSSVSMTSSPWVSPASSHCIRMLVHPPERHNTHSARLSS